MGLFDIFKTEEKSDDINLEEVASEKGLKLKDVVAPSALKISSRDINLGTKIMRTYFVISYPRFLNEGWFSPIVNLDKIYDISIFVHPVETERVLKQFQKKVAEIQSQINEREQKGQVRNPQLETAYSDLEDLRDRLQQAQEKLFSVGLYISIYGDDIKDLEKAETEIKSIFESRLIYLKPALFQQEDGLRSVLPTGTDLLKVHSKLNSEPLSSIFPFVSFDLTSDKGILFGINRHNSSLVLFDRFSLPNYNSVVFATSGAGKSYATKLEILRSLMFDTGIIVIDPEKEYEYMAKAVGGKFFDVSLTSEHTINPFELPEPDEDESFNSVLRSHSVHLTGLFRIMLDGLTSEEDALIDKAIAETYALKDITPDTDPNSDFKEPLLSEFEMVLSGMEGGDQLAQRLSKYTQGTWSGFLNKPSNVNIDHKFVVFSLRDMEDELKPVAMYIIMNHIWSTVRKDIKKRLLVIDEAWWMMKSEDTASFLLNLAKRGRKYYLGLSTITQDVGDFLNSPYGVPIITNSSIQLLLKQSSTTIDRLQKTFNLTDEEKYLLIESQVGEGMFFAGLKHVAVKIIASYTEDQIITSDPSQILSIKEEKQRLSQE
ncbi:MAG: VirB4-like conjugal transfer ATPase, CD1110 family [Patescibacteria group bacterium]